MLQTILAKVIGTQNERDLKKLRPIYESLDRAGEWNELLTSIREQYRNRPRFMEILDKCYRLAAFTQRFGDFYRWCLDRFEAGGPARVRGDMIDLAPYAFFKQANV